MQQLNKQDILKIIEQLDDQALLSCIEEAFKAYSNGTATVPPVGHLGFEFPPADVHIKYGYIQGDDHYVIKIASGFYKNPEIGLPSSNGMMLAFDARTGQLAAILSDEGYLTDLRTAIAGAVAAKHLAPQDVGCIGIVGTGIQARMQLNWLKTVTKCRKVLVWGRSTSKVLEFAQEHRVHGWEVDVAQDLSALAGNSNLIVTTTPAHQPLLSAEMIQPGTHITAMGADADGKQELDPTILGKSALVVADSISQCIDHGEIHHALKSGQLDAASLTEMGDLIVNGFDRPEEAITVADLTGIATQDIKIAGMTLSHFSE